MTILALGFGLLLILNTAMLIRSEAKRVDLLHRLCRTEQALIKATGEENPRI